MHGAPASSPVSRRAHRIAVTGLGVVCALGRDQREFWSNMMEGRRGIGALDLFDASGCLSQVAGQVRRIPEAEARRRDSRTDRFCLAAALEAVRQARLPGQALAEFGVSLGSSTAGLLEAERYCRDSLSRGFETTPVSRVLRLPTSAPADAVARRFGLRGPRLSNMTACASSALSIGHAADLIRAGEAPGIITGGGDALCQMTFAGFNALRLLDPGPCRPFAASRQGLSLGEGAGILILEDWDRAEARGARPLAELLDYGSSCDAHHMTAPHPEGRGAVAAMTEALARSGLLPSAIGHINAHGTGTSLNDATEAKAILAVFGGSAPPPVTSTKSQVGHLLGGSGGLEAATLVLSLLHQTIPPTLGYEPEPGAALDVVAGRPRELQFDCGISNSFGFGGTNCTLVFRRAS